MKPQPLTEKKEYLTEECIVPGKHDFVRLNKMSIFRRQHIISALEYHLQKINKRTECFRANSDESCEILDKKFPSAMMTCSNCIDRELLIAELKDSFRIWRAKPNQGELKS